MADGTLSPFVLWAQTDSHLSLRVDLRNVKNPNVQLIEDELEFTAIGNGAKGQNEYHFVLEFYTTVNPKESQFRVTDRHVEFNIKKGEIAWWPRLTAEQKKPAWLKIDFDKWKSEDDDKDEEEDEQIRAGPVNTELDELMKEITKEDKQDFPSVNDIRKFYLLLYNLIQFCGFTYILLTLSMNYSIEGADSINKAYQTVGSTMIFCQLLQLLEILHPLLGYTKGRIVEPLLQVGGRAFMLFAMIQAEPRMQSKPIVFYLFVVWSSIEVARYPYYMLRTYDCDIGWITWLRYTLWIPLYPLGFLCEGVIILRNIPYFEETRKFSYALPNVWNISLDFPQLLRLYLLLLCFPVMYFMMSHMYRQRVHRIGSKSLRNKNK